MRYEERSVSFLPVSRVYAGLVRDKDYFFPRCLYRERPWTREIVAPSRAKDRQLTARYRLSGHLKLKVHLL